MLSLFCSPNLTAYRSISDSTVSKPSCGCAFNGASRSLKEDQSMANLKPDRSLSPLTKRTADRTERLGNDGVTGSPSLTSVKSSSSSSSTATIKNSFSDEFDDFDDSYLDDVNTTTEKEKWRAKLGRSTWHFLHVMAAKYPVSPTDAERQDMRDFFEAFRKVYPCKLCRSHFTQLLKDHPLRVSYLYSILLLPLPSF